MSRPVRPDVVEKIETSRRAARYTECPRCGFTVIVGPDHDNVAHVATVEAWPLDAFEEMQAVTAGRHTYDLLPHKGGVALHAREPHNYTAAWPQRGTVHARHDCKGSRRDVHTLF